MRTKVANDKINLRFLLAWIPEKNLQTSSVGSKSFFFFFFFHTASRSKGRAFVKKKRS